MSYFQGHLSFETEQLLKDVLSVLWESFSKTTRAVEFLGDFCYDLDPQFAEHDNLRRSPATCDPVSGVDVWFKSQCLHFAIPNCQFWAMQNYWKVKRNFVGERGTHLPTAWLTCLQDTSFICSCRFFMVRRDVRSSLSFWSKQQILHKSGHHQDLGKSRLWRGGVCVGPMSKWGWGDHIPKGTFCSRRY